MANLKKMAPKRKLNNKEFVDKYDRDGLIRKTKSIRIKVIHEIKPFLTFDDGCYENGILHIICDYLFNSDLECSLDKILVIREYNSREQQKKFELVLKQFDKEFKEALQYKLDNFGSKGCGSKFETFFAFGKYLDVGPAIIKKCCNQMVKDYALYGVTSVKKGESHNSVELKVEFNFV